MTSPDALATVRRYHQSWTARHYDQAVDLLSPALVVEVPIGEYPTVDSFARALRDFGELVTSVELLAEMSCGEEAMLLYDMRVKGLGELRVVEHFTVAGGQIVRLRQVHDTAAVRAAAIAV